MNTREVGFLAENIAARHLIDGGYEILDKNYRKPWGEIDIIAKLNDTVVFVEVKANSQEFGYGFKPEIRVDQNKLAKIKRTAWLYLEHELHNTDLEWQIDIVTVIFDIPNKKAKISHFKNI
jgi:putative endonuclease